MGTEILCFDIRQIRCPLWVRSRHLQWKTPCPLYPQKRTFTSNPRHPRYQSFQKPLKSIGRQRGVAHCRSDRAVAGVVLDCPCVLAVIGELVAAGVAKHVTVDKEREACCLSGPGNHALIASHA